MTKNSTYALYRLSLYFVKVQRVIDSGHQGPVL
jgi:hypothetical protein